MVLFAGSRLRVGPKLDSYSSGDVYCAIDMQTGEDVAVKIEWVTSPVSLLRYEVKLYKLLGGDVGLPRMHWLGIEEGYNVMVMDLLGPSLKQLVSCCDHNFSLAVISSFGEQIINSLEYLHAKEFVYRNVKPENFLINLGTVERVHMIDLSLAKRYRCSKTRQHIPFRHGKKSMGNARYKSVNAHTGAEESRRDDLEALGYMLLRFYLGRLPGEGLRANSEQMREDQMMTTKISTDAETLCKGCPPSFVDYLTYCRGLTFDAQPDYAYLRRLVRNICVCDCSLYNL